MSIFLQFKFAAFPPHANLLWFSSLSTAKLNFLVCLKKEKSPIQNDSEVTFSLFVSLDIFYDSMTGSEIGDVMAMNPIIHPHIPPEVTTESM